MKNQGELKIILESEAYSSEMSRLANEAFDLKIEAITFDSRTINIELSNDCTLRADVKYLPPVRVGMCPRVDGVEVITECD